MEDMDFSDVLTMFLGMDTWVELYDAGRIPLTEFVNMKKDNDILVNIIVQQGTAFYLLFRVSEIRRRISRY